MDFETLIILSLRDLGFDDINHTLTESEIKAKYRDLAIKFHPDKQIFTDDSWIKKVNTAKDFLIKYLDQVNALIMRSNPSVMREQEIRKHQEQEAKKAAEEQKRKEEERKRREQEEQEAKKRREREEQERKKREEERKRREEAERLERQRIYEEKARQAAEERKRKLEEKRKFDKWYASLTPKQKKKYDKEQQKLAKKAKRDAYLKLHPNHRKLIIALCTFSFCIVALTVSLTCYFNVYLKNFYVKGMSLFNSNNYEEAKIEFDKAKGYKDASEYSIRSEAEILIGNGEKYKAGLLYGGLNTADDYLKSKEILWNDFIICQTIAMSSDFIVAIQDNGQLTGKQLNSKNHTYSEYANWKEINYLAMSEDMIVGLKSDGTVVVEGNDKINKKVKSWANIVQIYTAGEIVFGLRADGTILHTGSNGNKVLKEITTWKGVVNFDIKEHVYYPYDRDEEIHYYYAAAALADGKAKYCDDDNAYTSIVESWSDIKYVSLSYGEWIGVHVVGLKADNGVVACGTNNSGVCNVDSWTDIIQVHTMSTYTFGIKKDGSVILVGSDAFSKKDVTNIRNAVYMAKINNLLIVDENGGLQCENGKTLAMSEWKSIKVPYNPFKNQR